MAAAKGILMTDEEITKLVMDLSRSWKHRLVFDTKPFEIDMINMCKDVREAVQENFWCEHPAGCNLEGKCHYRSINE
jgi:hypothetical protein